MAAVLILSAMGVSTHGQLDEASPASEFMRRVDGYVHVRHAAEGDVLAAMKQHPGAVPGLADVLRRRIDREWPGSLFDAPVGIFFRQSLDPDVPAGATEPGPTGSDTEVAWPAVPFAIGQAAPSRSAPLEIIRVLPGMPESIGYQVAGRDLLVVDRVTSLVIGVLRGVIPAETRGTVTDARF
jgi:hypothetical protein